MAEKRTADMQGFKLVNFEISRLLKKQQGRNANGFMLSTFLG